LNIAINHVTTLCSDLLRHSFRLNLTSAYTCSVDVKNTFLVHIDPSITKLCPLQHSHNSVLSIYHATSMNSKLLKHFLCDWDVVNNTTCRCAKYIPRAYELSIKELCPLERSHKSVPYKRLHLSNVTSLCGKLLPHTHTHTKCILILIKLLTFIISIKPKCQKITSCAD